MKKKRRPGRKGRGARHRIWKFQLDLLTKSQVLVYRGASRGCSSVLPIDEGLEMLFEKLGPKFYARCRWNGPGTNVEIMRIVPREEWPEW